MLSSTTCRAARRHWISPIRSLSHAVHGTNHSSTGCVPSCTVMPLNTLVSSSAINCLSSRRHLLTSSAIQLPYSPIGLSFPPQRQFATAVGNDALASASSAHPDIKLYQYHICPFCNITKSIFSYSNLNYQAVEVNPLTKAELKPWYVFIPSQILHE
jgi:hypothetical protein